MDLKSLIGTAESMPDYPLHTWQPVRQASIDISIQADGSWWHEGSVFTRPKLVQLFSRLLAYRDGQYCLVTPVEQLTIQVEKLPFVIVSSERLATGIWQLTTNLGDQLSLTSVDQLRVDMSKPDQIPEVRVRDNLWASVSRQVYYDLALTVETLPRNGQLIAQLHSGNCVYDFGILE
ncbi:MAG TPA: DUF1285 domain-containing protein [Oceanospirillaceae bacterium]|nr:DUF1285 domain-containing protein [Oceanospirillaceae bacterium]